MCLNLKAVAAAVKLGAPVQSAVCWYKGTACPFFKRCQYQQRRATVGAADVVFAAHEILFDTPETYRPVCEEGQRSAFKLVTALKVSSFKAVTV